MFCIQQRHQHDCGFTCIKIMLANLNKDDNYLYLASPFKETEDVSLFDLAKLASSKYGLILKASRVVDKSEISKNDKVPFIALINDNGLRHAVYVYKITNKKVYYYDPKGVYEKLKKEDFINLWTGELLRCDGNSYMPSEYRKPVLIKIKERIFATFLSFLSGLSLVGGVYFLSKDNYFFVPLIFLSMMIIIEILLKKYLISLLKRMDQRIEDYYTDIKDKKYYQFYQYFEQYKSSIIISDVTLFSHLFTILIIALIMLINAKMNAIYLGVNVLLAIFTSFIVQPYFIKEENKMNMLEESIVEINDIDEMNNHFFDLRKTGYSYGEKLHAYKYVISAIQLIVSFVLMMVSEVVNVTYIICYFFMEVYLYNALVAFFDVETRENAQNLLNKITGLLEKNS